jgi:hypothetical protein
MRVCTWEGNSGSTPGDKPGVMDGPGKEELIEFPLANNLASQYTSAASSPLHRSSAINGTDIFYVKYAKEKQIHNKLSPVIMSTTEWRQRQTKVS